MDLNLNGSAPAPESAGESLNWKQAVAATACILLMACLVGGAIVLAVLAAERQRGPDKDEFRAWAEKRAAARAEAARLTLSHRATDVLARTPGGEAFWKAAALDDLKANHVEWPDRGRRPAEGLSLGRLVHASHRKLGESAIETDVYLEFKAEGGSGVLHLRYDGVLTCSGATWRLLFKDARVRDWRGE
jgi:hypothetical protein